LNFESIIEYVPLVFFMQLFYDSPKRAPHNLFFREYSTVYRRANQCEKLLHFWKNND